MKRLYSEGKEFSTRKLALFLVFAASLVCQSPSNYRITHTYPLGGEGSWDYVVPDPPNHRLFIARQNRVMVVDEDSGKLLAEVSGIDGAHGAAIAEGTGHGFATEGNGKSVAMFDLKTYKTLGRIPAAEDADAIVLRRALEPCLYTQRRRSLLHRHRAQGGQAHHQHSAGRQAGIWCFGRRRQSLCQPHRHWRGGRDRCRQSLRRAAMVHRAVQEPSLNGDRHRAPSPVQRLPV